MEMKETGKITWKQVEESNSKKFAESWANEMERMLEENVMLTIEDVAFEAFDSCVRKSPITGQEEYESVGLLGKFWYKGNELYQLWIDGGIIPE